MPYRKCSKILPIMWPCAVIANGSIGPFHCSRDIPSSGLLRNLLVYHCQFFYCFWIYPSRLSLAVVNWIWVKTRQWLHLHQAMFGDWCSSPRWFAKWSWLGVRSFSFNSGWWSSVMSSRTKILEIVYPSLMLLCIGVLQCLWQVKQWSPKLVHDLTAKADWLLNTWP